jgi:sn-glycerol 3-phosphate transport system substrate-binding protein
MRDAHVLHRRAGEFPAERQVRLVGELHAVSRRRQGRAAELDHRRRVAVDHGRQEALEYKGVAKFFSFLSSPEIQMEWHTGTGYVPITMAAYELTKKSGFYEKNPGADVAIKELTNKPPTANSKGIRFGNYVQGREVIEEEMEAVFAGKKDAKTALDDAVKRGNDILRKFQAANK